MKKIFTLAMMMVMTITAYAVRPSHAHTARISYNTAKKEALFLSDKMAYELNLTDAQYDAVYEINLDYLMSVNGQKDANGTWWKRRNSDLKYVLTAWQYERFIDKSYFYRPLTWKNGSWTFNVYNHYTNRSHFHRARPKAYTSYKGGNNKKSDRFYADRNVNKPTSTTTARHDDDKKSNGNGSSWRNTNSNHHELAHNTSDNHHNSTGHFGNHR